MMNPKWQPTKERHGPSPSTAFGANRNNNNNSHQPSVSSQKQFPSGPFAPTIVFVQLERIDRLVPWTQVCFENEISAHRWELRTEQRGGQTVYLDETPAGICQSEYLLLSLRNGGEEGGQKDLVFHQINELAAKMHQHACEKSSSIQTRQTNRRLSPECDILAGPLTVPPNFLPLDFSLSFLTSIGSLENLL